jgi:hypothetical protein
MARYEVHRSDGNAKAIYDAMRKAGASVEIIDRPCDAIIGVQGLSAEIEVKTARGQLRPSQKAFKASWRGYFVVVRSVEDGLAVVEDLRWMASVLQRVGWPKEQAGE